MLAVPSGNAPRPRADASLRREGSDGVSQRPPLEWTTEADLDRYLALTNGIDRDAIRRLALDEVRHQRDPKAGREAEPTDLDLRWYSSLSAGQPDYGIYDAPECIANLWSCWVIYSRMYVLALGKLIARGVLPAEMDTVVDLGCGLGYTTAALGRLWPSAKVAGTNIGVQLDAASRLGAAEGFLVTADIPRADLVFASEYFEHFQRPLDHLREVLDAAGRPRYVVTANAFGSASAGHFPIYLDEIGRDVPGSKMGRLFGTRMRSAGYSRLATGFWNDRPAVWVSSRTAGLWA
jgi:SAM-dependent methyltransferase